MPDVATLREDLGKVVAQLNAISEAYKLGSMPADKKQQCDTLVRKGRELKAAIEEEIKAAARSAEIGDLDDFLNKPDNQVPHGIEGEGGGVDDERKAMQRAGWEFKSGSIWRQTSVGKSVEMWKEDVLFG